MSEAASNIEIVRGLWSALSERDWRQIASFFESGSVYYDVPVGPTSAARGPESIVARLRLGLEPLASYENVERNVATSGDVVMVEHEETWQWPTGEAAVLPFVTVHRVVDGKILLWKDYWDYATLVDAAPPGWQESLLQGDISWVFDATGLA
jgi:limonene-1,2-epoxide hydrolase